MHTSLEPHTIHEVTLGANESIILVANGEVKFFQTPKKLVTVEYLSSVKAICSTRDGFALIKSSSNGMNFFVEIHPDKFQATEEPNNIKSYDISFDNSGCHSSWHRSQFKIKELHFPSPASNQFLARIIRAEVPLNEFAGDRFLFFSIDNNLFSLQTDPEEHFVVPVVTCTGDIVDFWVAKNGNWIALLLNSGAMMLMCLSKDGAEVNHELVYFGSEITAFALADDLFIYSNDALVEWMHIELNKELVEFVFNRNSVNLPGIAAITILAEFSIAVAISENCQFYAIKMPLSEQQVTGTSSKDAKKWYAVDRNMVDQLKRLKLDLVELANSYDNILGRQLTCQHMFDAIELKRADIRAEAGKKPTPRFVASCLATKLPPTLSAGEESQAINITSSLAYDRNSSFFVRISLVAVTYANEFNTNIWNLRCRWLNDMRANEYVNVKLTTESLLQPLNFIVHLRQQYLPEFEMDVNTIVKIGESYAYLSFPVHLTQPNYCDLLQVISTSSPLPVLPNRTELICTAKLPRGITLNDLFHGKLINQPINVIKSDGSSYEIRLLGKRLTLTHRTDDAQIIELRCADAALMYYTKIYVYDIIRQRLTRAKQIVQVTANALKEYSVSTFCMGLLTADHHIVKCLLSFSFQNFDNFVNVVDELSQNNNSVAHEMVQCIGKIRLVPAIEYTK